MAKYVHNTHTLVLVLAKCTHTHTQNARLGNSCKTIQKMTNVCVSMREHERVYCTYMTVTRLLFRAVVIQRGERQRGCTE